MAGIKEYSITLTQDELILDVDDLYGICQQLEAISYGFGMDFNCHTIIEKEIILWSNEQKNPNKDG